MLRKFVLGLMVVMATSCAKYYSSTGENQYLRSKNGELLQVPPPLTRDNVSDFYNLPEQTADPKISIEPPNN